MISAALAAARAGEEAMRRVIEALPAPIYVTDPDGRITYYNRACSEFAGRSPELGRDSWCVTWKLYTNEGEFLPHDQCPMAVAIKEKKAVRGVSAVAERPDGSRVRFVPYPTPLLDEAGELVAAVNMLIDVSDVDAAALRDQALRCRRLALAINDRQTVATLLQMAGEYDEQANSLKLVH